MCGTRARGQPRKIRPHLQEAGAALPGVLEDHSFSAAESPGPIRNLGAANFKKPRIKRRAQSYVILIVSEQLNFMGAITEQPFSTSHSLFNSCDLPLFQKSSKIFGLNLKCGTLHLTKKKVLTPIGICACIILLQELVNVN